MEIVIYTDGGCEPNPGRGGWAFVCVDPYIERSGGKKLTTNNEMEMTAVLKAIEFSLEVRADVIKIFSDSRYVVDGFNSWMHKWRRNGWKRSPNSIDPLKNLELWKELYKYKNKAILQWVKGHNGNEFNESADELAQHEIMKLSFT